MKHTYVIDGARFSTLESFFDEISRVMVPNHEWGRNLDAFNDILRGGFGTPEEGFDLRWVNSATSREKLGYPETVRQLRMRLERCHPSNQKDVANELKQAELGAGPTVFDWLVDIVWEHCADGTESQNGVQLLLE